jgi:Protein of unknown function (DUF1579)
MDMMEMPKPQKEHQWLQRLVGEWTFEHECPPAPDQPPVKFTGTDSVRSLGGVWVVCEGKSQMPDGSPALTIMTLGFDPDKKRFVGTFIGSMMTYLWIYDGQLDASGKVLTLDAEGPNFTEPGKMVKYQDIIEFVNDDHRTLSSQTLGEDGKWQRFMTVHYRRVR